MNAINNAWRDLKLLTRAREVGGAGGKLRHAVELPNCRTAELPDGFHFTFTL
ncbi:hypothetical protein EHW99_1395 [Erwinia amylovora]|nr:hypothetical protein EHX00_1395 [Erwinia amylovora]QJQ57798.1 hypothetical protein EHW99_1395 [Erwinia amylovora]QJQ61497.1 hypothetical protein EHW98_1395 [Erwinia amylovora]QJQ65299.1 hypothetical protein EHW96_1395 [Erwinia amylovora]QJQ68998.1 hypothetical protein EGZ89_1395 [Erwinia amylovora]